MKRAAVPSMAAAAPRRVLDEPVSAHVPGAGLDDHFRTYGMYPPSESRRDGAAAFTLRPDLQLADVLETVGRLLRQADGIASALACDGSLDEGTTSAAEALAYLLQQARGLHSLVLPVVAGAVLDEGAAQRADGGAS